MGKEIKIRRITCDLDRLDESMLSHTLKVFEKYGFDKDIEIEVSSGGKGFHVIAWSDKGVSLKKLLKIREMANDDGARIKLDSITGREINVLFTGKKVSVFNNLSEALNAAIKEYEGGMHE